MRRILLLPGLACGLALVLAGCGEQPSVVRTPPPLARAPTLGEGPPDTKSLGAGPAVVSCGLKRPDDLLRQINIARAAARRCGVRAMGPARPLNWDAALSSAASAHSADMARRRFFDHQDPDGRSVMQRASASGYGWKSIGENIAGGQTSPEEAMQNWLASAEHCENLMDPAFADVAVACVQKEGTEYGTYWTMVLGRRR
jgi:uncharacterized protein YkwD